MKIHLSPELRERVAEKQPQSLRSREILSRIWQRADAELLRQKEWEQRRRRERERRRVRFSYD